MRRILSGVRPTGGLQLGNYLGAIRNWVSLQDTFDDCLFCIVDLHALTTLENTSSLKDDIHEVAAAYIACGIDPNRFPIFAQSHVPAHAELAWILGCFTPMGWLNRMTQFKDKAGKNQENAMLGLYAYPVLMAADILIYKATHVPVGEDQKQHLELTRDLAGLFNRRFKEGFFPIPEPQILGEATRVMSLRDGSVKMSKSDASDYSRINLLDNADTIALKIRKARTDAEPLPDNLKDLESRPEARNLINIYAALSGKTAIQVCMQFTGSYFSTFKKDLSDLLISVIEPIGNKMRQLLREKTALDAILNQGAESANKLADKHIREIRHVIGFL